MKTRSHTNVILIGVDTLRYDRLGFSGYKKNISPNIDDLASESIVFHNCFAQAPSGAASFASLLTSRYPTFHGIFTVPPGSNVQFQLSDNVPTLQEILRESGYVTAAFINEKGVSRQRNLSIGFDHYKNLSEDLSVEIDKHPVIEWIEGNHRKPFFLFFHTYATHGPYMSFDPVFGTHKNDPEGTMMSEIEVALKNLTGAQAYEYIQTLRGSKAAMQHLGSMYDSCVSQLDGFIALFLARIRSLGIDENTLIIITAAHGEEFGERGGAYHDFLNDEVLHVPLLIRMPKTRSRNDINQIVRTIDIMPTIFDILGIQHKAVLQGVSLLPATNDKNLDLTAISEKSPVYYQIRKTPYNCTFLLFSYLKKPGVELRNFVVDEKHMDEHSNSLIHRLHDDFQRELVTGGLMRPPYKVYSPVLKAPLKSVGEVR